MKLSVILSIHNRARLFSRALRTYLSQTLPAEEWEIVLVDDLSSEDQASAYRPFLGRINLRHIFFDHTRHALFKKRNPVWEPGRPKDWFHTPALTTNLGCSLARAPLLGLFHPEVLHAPDNFLKAVTSLERAPSFLFGKVWLGTPAVNLWLETHPEWSSLPWDAMMEASGAYSCRAFRDDERYWYCSFLPFTAVDKTGGVDFEFLHGVAYEDCDFKERVNRAGFPDRVDPSLSGLHQDHSHETEPHRIRDNRWHEAAVRNGQLFRTRLHRSGFPDRVNVQMDWTARECATRMIEYQVGNPGAVYEGALP